MENEHHRVRIILADDHVLLAEAVQNILLRSGRYDVEIVDKLSDLMTNISRSTFDIVLLDIKMPGMSGLSSVRDVLSKIGDGKLVLFSGQVDINFVAEAVSFGVHSFIPKTMPLKSLESALSLIYSGQSFVPVVKSTATDAIASGNESQPLSERELSVLQLAANGLTNKEIAREMALTEVSIKMHMRSICKKLGARNRAHAATISRERMII